MDRRNGGARSGRGEGKREIEAFANLVDHLKLDIVIVAGNYFVNFLLQGRVQVPLSLHGGGVHLEEVEVQEQVQEQVQGTLGWAGKAMMMIDMLSLDPLYRQVSIT